MPKITAKALNQQKKSRILTGSSLLFICFIGACCIEAHPQTFLLYTQVMSLLCALVSFWLCWFLDKKNSLPSHASLWHHFLHWLGTLISLYAITILITDGLLSAHQAGIISMMILSLALFIAGVHSETLFMLLGITLGAITCIIPSAHQTPLLYTFAVCLLCLFTIVGLSTFQEKQSKKALNAKNKTP